MFVLYILRYILIDRRRILKQAFKFHKFLEIISFLFHIIKNFIKIVMRLETTTHPLIQASLGCYTLQEIDILFPLFF